MTRNMNPPIPGHALIAEGRYLGFAEILKRHVGGCQCGAQPPGWPEVSVNATKRWHRQHKAELREDGKP